MARVKRRLNQSHVPMYVEADDAPGVNKCAHGDLTRKRQRARITGQFAKDAEHNGSARQHLCRVGQWNREAEHASTGHRRDNETDKQSNAASDRGAHSPRAGINRKSRPTFTTTVANIIQIKGEL